MLDEEKTDVISALYGTEITEVEDKLLQAFEEYININPKAKPEDINKFLDSIILNIKQAVL